MVVTLLLFAAADQTLQLSHEPVTASARASVLILKPAVGSKASWDIAPPRKRKEVTLTDENGKRTRIRLIEFE
jgi:hypothetical protein